MISSQEGIWESEYYTTGENKQRTLFVSFQWSQCFTENQNKGKYYKNFIML